MSGRGMAPKEQRRNAADVPMRGEWQATPGIGWQHGEPPAPPSSLRAETRDVWATWMAAWFAAHWLPEDLPGLRMVIRLYNRTFASDCTAAERTELRQLMDSYGITPKGQQDRRWTAPKAVVPKPLAQPDVAPVTRPSRWDHLRTVAS